MMTYQEYMEKYGKCFGHENYDGGETMIWDLEELLGSLKTNGYACPDVVSGGVPVKMTIDPKNTVCDIEETLWDEDFSGEDYEISEEGRAFLTKCFEEYNEKYANNGNYYDTVDVLVPDEMKYKLSETEE